MSQPTIEQFYQEVTQDPALQQRLQSAPDQQSLVNTVVAIGQQKGYSFTTKEVGEWIAANQNTSGNELNDAELEGVAGGKGGGGKSSKTEKFQAGADAANAAAQIGNLIENGVQGSK